MMAAPGIVAVIVERGLHIVFYQLFAYVQPSPLTLSSYPISKLSVTRGNLHRTL